jgi:hypothetical protein
MCKNRLDKTKECGILNNGFDKFKEMIPDLLRERLTR